MKKLLIMIGILLPALALPSSQGVPTLTVATVTSTPSLVLPQNLNRATILIQNVSGSNCYFAPVAFTGLNGLYLANGQNYDSQEAFIKSAFYASCTNGGSLIFLESNY